MADKNYWESLLVRTQEECGHYKTRIKEETAIIKRLMENENFDVAVLKEHKDTVKMYRGFVAELSKTLREIEDRIARTSEPGKLGRPTIGKPRVVKITLPEEDWQHIDQAVAMKKVSSVADYFRTIHDSSLSDFLIVE